MPYQPHSHAEPHTAFDRSPCGRRAQRKFLDLGGSAENQGDLKSVVLHKMTLGAHKSTFPIALGVRMTGVDDSCFSQTGESYSMIAMPNADSHNSRVLQEDNTDLAYEFARKFRTLAPARATALPTPLTRPASPLQRGTPPRTWTRRESTKSPRAASASSRPTTPWFRLSPRMRELRPLSPCPLPHALPADHRSPCFLGSEKLQMGEISMMPSVHRHSNRVACAHPFACSPVPPVPFQRGLGEDFERPVRDDPADGTRSTQTPDPKQQGP